MATKKPVTSELIAIYRLEFYKKQKNWKLSTDAQKEKESKAAASEKNNNILNETYSIALEEDWDCELNDAFLKHDSDPVLEESPKHISSEEAPKRELHAQAMRPVQACQECSGRAQNPWSYYVDPGQESREDLEFEGYEGCVDGMVWTNSGYHQEGLAEGCSLSEVPLVAGGAWGEAGGAWSGAGGAWSGAGGALWPDMWEEEDGLPPLDGSAQFLAGAHAAPHSSELELSLREGGGGGGCGCRGGASGLSPGRLAAALQQHAAALRALLREADARRVAQMDPSLSLDAVPVRLPPSPRPGHAGDAWCPPGDTGETWCPPGDAGEQAFPVGAPRFADEFVAGSHRQRARRGGRGRGRLADW